MSVLSGRDTATGQSGVSLASLSDVKVCVMGMGCVTMSASESLSLPLAYQPGGLLRVMPGAVSVSESIH